MFWFQEVVFKDEKLDKEAGHKDGKEKSKEKRESKEKGESYISSFMWKKKIINGTRQNGFLKKDKLYPGPSPTPTNKQKVILGPAKKKKDLIMGCRNIIWNTKNIPSIFVWVI